MMSKLHTVWFALIILGITLWSSECGDGPKAIPEKPISEKRCEYVISDFGPLAMLCRADLKYNDRGHYLLAKITIRELIRELHEGGVIPGSRHDDLVVRFWTPDLVDRYGNPGRGSVTHHEGEGAYLFSIGWTYETLSRINYENLDSVNLYELSSPMYRMPNNPVGSQILNMLSDWDK
jgi:hypothetical protein